MVSSRMHLFKWLVLMISIISTISDGRARARTGLDKPKGAVKTIKSYETGEVIDCVDIFKQSAFHHPLLKNHTIQMKSSSNRKANGVGYVGRRLSQAWRKYGECPEGTIPIRRPQNHTNHPVIWSTPPGMQLDRERYVFSSPPRHEYAQVSLVGGEYTGASATINVWNPTVSDSEYSFSYITLIGSAGPTKEKNVVHTGWMVNPHSKHAKTFVYWTSDGYKQTGCYNLDCPGFLQTNSDFALGSQIQPVSTYDGPQFEISIEIRKNEFTGHWWLRIGDVEVGYWPREIFTTLSGPAHVITWGGAVLRKKEDGPHTSTQMGSGHFPSEGFKKAAYFRDLKFFNDEFIERDPWNLIKYATRPECYDAQINVDSPNLFGINFYYGGPGFSDRCV